MDDLTPTQKGATAEAFVSAVAIQMGLVVLRPFPEGARYDLVLDLEPELIRVQCKLARHRGGVLCVRLRTSRYTPRGYVFTSYTAAEIDAVAAYSPEMKRAYLIPIREVAGRRAMHLRLDPTANNQARGIKWAQDYDFEETIRAWPGASASRPGAG